MFALSKYDVLGLYGEKLLFMPNLKAAEEEEVSSSVDKIETIKTNSVLFQSQSPIISIPKEEDNKGQEENVVVEKIETLKTALGSNTILPQVILTQKEENTIEKPLENLIEKNKTNLVEKGEKIQWKMRPNVPCKVIVVVAEQEFKNAVLMGALLFILEEKCKINRSNVSFGVFQNGQKTFDFSDMPATTGVLFAEIEAEKPVIPNKNIAILPSMATIALNTTTQETCINLFKSL